MLLHPDWLTVAERRVIDDELERVKNDAPFTNDDPPSRHVFIVRLHGRFLSDADTISAVVRVARKIVDVLSVPRIGRIDDERHAAAVRYIDAVIEELDVFRPASTSWTFEQFLAEARAAVQQNSWWTAFVSPRSVPPIAPRLITQQSRTDSIVSSEPAPDKWLTVEEVMPLLRIKDEETIISRIHEGTLIGKKRGRRWFISARSVKAQLVP